MLNKIQQSKTIEKCKMKQEQKLQIRKDSIKKNIKIRIEIKYVLEISCRHQMGTVLNEKELNSKL